MVEKRDKENPAYFEGVRELGILPTIRSLILKTAWITGLINCILLVKTLRLRSFHEVPQLENKLVEF